MHKKVAFEVQIKGALQVAIELHLKMHIVVHLLAQKSSQSNSIKGEHEEALYVALEGAPKISLQEARKIAKKCQEIDAFDVSVDDSLDDVIKCTPFNLFTRPLYLIQSRTNRIVDILKLDSEADAQRCLQPFTEKSLFMSIFFTKVADRKPEKRLHQRCFPVSLPNITELFFAKHVWVVIASAKYHSFSLMNRPPPQTQDVN